MRDLDRTKPAGTENVRANRYYGFALSGVFLLAAAVWIGFAANGTLSMPF